MDVKCSRSIQKPDFTLSVNEAAPQRYNHGSKVEKDQIWRVTSKLMTVVRVWRYPCKKFGGTHPPVPMVVVPVIYAMDAVHGTSV